MAKAPKPFQPSVAISNDLGTGVVVFRSAEGAWVSDLAGAEIAETRAAADALLTRARADHDAGKVIEPTLIAVVREKGFVRPLELRELIRATGPTIPLPGSAR
ncbi:DUF2849 domain-containing protein [Blastochloris viridis]|uniref:DUF2849 domain-containing protein n=1 Tax=Blastochloris viridis TaxID=1079 RepID=A0A0H5BQ33_BLAVI|nr:DUF2849 domain-containing protein [Blastochloris viridis]ALK09827.1 hypothetical protein BVIR_2057 [Blastochloris viridis]BAS00269.1 hypothetical protein BV133_2675 [Blastochloris viridis]CUU42490.1 hypothetical protein BVIRIDIS_15020 [Blastochloris viridis]